MAITKTTEWFADVYTGTAEELIAESIIEVRHLPPQRGRPMRKAVFLPNGSPLPPGGSIGQFTPGRLAIWVRHDGILVVTRNVDECTQRQRIGACPPHHGRWEHIEWVIGTAEQLRRAGVPAREFEGLHHNKPTGGSKRTIYDGPVRIVTSVGSKGRYRIERTHIDYYRNKPQEYERQLRRYGLTPAPLFTSVQKGGAAQTEEQFDPRVLLAASACIARAMAR